MTSWLAVPLTGALEVPAWKMRRSPADRAPAWTEANGARAKPAMEKSVIVFMEFKAV
jgi:hypothetical protein